MEKQDRQQKIRDKGFAMNRTSTIDEYGRIKIGAKTVEDAVIDLGYCQKIGDGRMVYNKKAILKAIAEKDLKARHTVLE